MVLWILLPVSLSLISFVGTWAVYALAYYNKHVCSLSDWDVKLPNLCRKNETMECCLVPTISSSGSGLPENCLFTATINSTSFLFMVFSIFHHAHIMERNSTHSMLSKFALAFGMVAACGAFAAGNCNAEYLQLLHYLGAAISFMCICFYVVLLTALTGKCVLTGFEKILYPMRIVFTVVQVIATICYTISYAQEDYWYTHISAVFEWALSINLELFEFSYAVEFCFFSSYMISNLLSKKDERKPLMLRMA